MLVAKQLSVLRKQLFDYFAAVHVGVWPRSANALDTFTHVERRHPPRRQHDRLPHHSIATAAMDTYQKHASHALVYGMRAWRELR